ncbi:nuclear transport factor 2 family protein [Leifsonia sp. F6_8S_P_1B]|uniref:Nuclear transport factor 2 family protein n=1 Tax=Leifsonia williamsii TaxID=3035919 RepID=A0ABT8K9W1_9MICO|nr:nuclear transport factor 2 family protein [Leifsonia williamsii]MDN4614238.1 nuclear transport factor 2 family protein [Leifsonia williamsii]
MTTIPELLHANLHDVFGNRDAATRRAAIDRIYAEDVVFTDPEGEVRGRDALEQKAAGLLASVPEAFAFAEDGPQYLSETAGVLAWTFGPEGAPAVRGVDVIRVADGRIVSLLTVLAPSEG